MAHKTPKTLRKLVELFLQPRSITLALAALGFVVTVGILGYKIPCPFYELTGWHCPGCGISRLFLALFDINFYQAFRWNPFVFILLPFAIFLLLDYVLKYIADSQNSLYYKIPSGFWTGLLVAVIVYGILRNLPAFAFLAPTAI